MCLDGASNQKEFKLDIFLVSSEGAHSPLSVMLGFEFTNNMAKYEAYRIGLYAAIDRSKVDMSIWEF